MSILRAITQMKKQRDRLIAKILNLEDEKKDIDKNIEALEAQIAGIDSAIASLETPVKGDAS